MTVCLEKQVCKLCIYCLRARNCCPPSNGPTLHLAMFVGEVIQIYLCCLDIWGIWVYVIFHPYCGWCNVCIKIWVGHTVLIHRILAAQVAHNICIFRRWRGYFLWMFLRDLFISISGRRRAASRRVPTARCGSRGTDVVHPLP